MYPTLLNNERFTYLESSVSTSNNNCSIVLLVASDDPQVSYGVLDHPNTTTLLSYIHDEVNN